MQFLVDVLECGAIIMLGCSVSHIAKAISETSFRIKACEALDKQIHRELYENRTGMGLYDVKVRKKKYFNQVMDPITVSFRLPDHDWSILEKSDEWHKVEELLSEAQSKHSQKLHQDQK